MDSQLFAGPVVGFFCSGLNAYCMQTGPLFLRISGSSGVLKAFLLERNRQLSCNPKKKKKKKKKATQGSVVAHPARLRDVWGLQCLHWQVHAAAGMLPFCLLLHPHPAPDHQPHVFRVPSSCHSCQLALLPLAGHYWPQACCFSCHHPSGLHPRRAMCFRCAPSDLASAQTGSAT